MALHAWRIFALLFCGIVAACGEGGPEQSIDWVITGFHQPPANSDSCELPTTVTNNTDRNVTDLLFYAEMMIGDSSGGRALCELSAPLGRGESAEDKCFVILSSCAAVEQGRPVVADVMYRCGFDGAEPTFKPRVCKPLITIALAQAGE